MQREEEQWGKGGEANEESVLGAAATLFEGGKWRT